ncbi:Hypothetical predicted protein [Paramuricea clavata]|uniref:Pentraxin family member n=1 Tax=Paramuricea clavata TaxID=317549 RepID=A0A6S7IJP0_PARCT|nr:Hypothetical predicted protein [Paramuricea clavata]
MFISESFYISCQSVQIKKSRSYKNAQALCRDDGECLFILNSSGLIVADGNLHHVCFTWDSGNGKTQIYKDGNLSKIMVNVRIGKKIKGGGIWVIGQDQDSLGGSFQAVDSFKGILTEVNIWDRVLGFDEIKRFAKDCDLLMQGNYKAYADFDISRATRLIKPSSCHFASIPKS